MSRRGSGRGPHGRRVLLGLALLAPSAACAPRASRAPIATPAAPTTVAERAPDDAHAGAPGPLLAPARLAALPAADRAAWARFLAASRDDAARDRAALRAELARLGLAAPRRAPSHHGFRVEPTMTAAWMRSDSGRALTASVLSWQTPSGGWGKRLDLYAGPRAPGTTYGAEGDGWSFVPTIDNEATTQQLRFLARALAAGGAPDEAAVRGALRRGVEYLLRAQYPNGCVPQVYPLQGGYHDAATYNDDATVNVLRVLRDVADGRLAGVDPALAPRAREALARGIGCVVRTQVREHGVRTAWGQQHDPLDGAPIGARTYEHASLASKESASIVDFLMELDAPSPEVVGAVHAAADWFRRSALADLVYEYGVGPRTVAGAPPIWARMYELGTGRPLFSNRDGVRRYRYDELTDRRQGYAWYSDQPRTTLRRYDAWARTHARVDASTSAR